MTLKEALEKKIIIKDEHENCEYNGKCKECKHSKQYSYPASSNMCMNEKPKRLYCKNCGKWTWIRYSDGALVPREKAHIPNVGNYCEDCFRKTNK